MDIKEKIKLKLKVYGVDVDDDTTLNLFIEDTKQSILNIANRNDFPDALNNVLVNRVVGIYLQDKINTNSLNVASLADKVVSSITRGDVSMTYKTEDRYTTMLDYINSLTEYGLNEIYRFRRLTW